MKKYRMRLMKAGNLFICLFLALIWCNSGICKEAELPDGSKMQASIAGISQASNKITLDIKGMDILDVLKILSMKSGLNIVAGRNVTGKVTIYLKDVDVWDAFQIILVANSLAYERTGDIINVMTDRDYELIYGDRFYDKKEIQTVKLKYAKAAEVSKALMQIKTNIGKIVTDEGSNTVILVDIPERVARMKQMINEIDVPTQTKVFSLQYAKAEDIEKGISELITKNLGVIKIDARTNSVVVTDLPQQLEKIEKIIAAFDKKDAQVMIEAKILEITLNDNFKMGIDWDVIARKYFRLTQNLKLSLTEGGTIKVGTITGGGSPTVKGEYSGLIEALREVGDVNTLSAPRIMALNNQESKILIGTKEPYSTKSTVASEQTTTTAESVTFVDLGVKLYVTPTINEDGFITMKIKPEVSSKSGTYTTADKNTIPIISTTEAETSIMVKDGATIVIAGLIKDTLSRTSYKIPFLGDIPVLGRVFSNNSDLKKKEEIVILLTPHIVSGEFTFAEVERWKRQEELLDKAKDRVEQEELKQKRLQEKEKAKAESQIKRAQKEQSEKKEQKEVAAEQGGIIVRSGAQDAAVKEAALLGGDYDNYFLNMKRRLQDQIRSNFSGMQLKGQGTVSFMLDAAGNLKGEPQIISEDAKAIGDVLIESVKLASPFEKFPEAFDAQEEKFTISVSFEGGGS